MSGRRARPTAGKGASTTQDADSHSGAARVWFQGLPVGSFKRLAWNTLKIQTQIEKTVILTRAALRFSIAARWRVVGPLWSYYASGTAPTVTLISP